MTEEMRTVYCCTCDREFQEPEKLYKNGYADPEDRECNCCYDEHKITWDYTTAQDNGCGDGCIIDGECDECGATGTAEFSSRNVEFEVSD